MEHIVLKEEDYDIDITKMAELIKEPITVIKSWTDKHQDDLYMIYNKDGVKFAKATIEQFKIIKMLCRNKNLTHKEISHYLEEHGFTSKKNVNTLQKQTNNIYLEILKSDLTEEHRNQLASFLRELLDPNGDFKESVINELKGTMTKVVKEVLENCVDDINYKLQGTVSKEMEQTKETIYRISKNLNNLNQKIDMNEKKESDRLSKLDEHLRCLMDTKSKDRKSKKEIRIFKKILSKFKN